MFAITLCPITVYCFPFGFFIFFCFILSAVIAVVFKLINTLFLFPKCDINFHEFMFTSLDEVTFDMESTHTGKEFAPKEQILSIMS